MIKKLQLVLLAKVSYVGGGAVKNVPPPITRGEQNQKQRLPAKSGTFLKLFLAPINKEVQLVPICDSIFAVGESARCWQRGRQK